MSRHALRRTQAWSAAVERSGHLNGDAGIGSGDADGFLITSLTHIRYLTGFSGSNAALLLTDGAAILITDGRYVTQAGVEAPDVEIVVSRNVISGFLDFVRAQLGRQQWWCEADHLSVDEWLVLGAEDGLRMLPLKGAVESVRLIKDDEEMAHIRRACQISSTAFMEVIDRVQPGWTERDLAAALEFQMRHNGADGAAFDTIVAAGEHSAQPHHRPTDRPIQPGDLVVVDWGAKVNGYHSDQTRTLVMGAAHDWQQELLSLVRSSQQAALALLERHFSAGPASETFPEVSRPVATCDVDRAARQVIVDAGFGEHFVHGLGHGVGLEIHEAPMMGATSEGMLLCDSPVTVEPGVYLAGKGGVRWEDLVVATRNGLETLTQAPHDCAFP